MHENIADEFALDEEARCANEAQAPDLFGMADGDFGRDPATGTMADEIELLEFERIEDLEPVEDHVLDRCSLGQFAAAVDTRKCRSDQPAALC